MVPLYPLRPPFVSRGFVMSSTVLDADPTALILAVVISLDTYVSRVLAKSPDVAVRVTDHTGLNPFDAGGCALSEVQHRCTLHG